MAQFGASYISSGYVKWIESAGGRVVPLHYDAPVEELEALVDSLHGVLYPGGGPIRAGTQFYDNAEAIYNRVREQHKPLFGICMGFELISAIASGDTEILSKVDARNLTLPLDFTSEAHVSRLFGAASKEIVSTVTEKPVTANYHQWGLEPSAFYGSDKLSQGYVVTSTNEDRQGVKFVSTMESRCGRVIATQWHPEKNAYEHQNKKAAIDHSMEAIHAMHYFAEVFMSSARAVDAGFPSDTAEREALIYNTPIVYAGGAGVKFYTQAYVWGEPHLGLHEEEGEVIHYDVQDE